MEYRFVPRVAYRSYRDEERLQGLIRFCKHTGAAEMMLVPMDSRREPVWPSREGVVERVAHTRRTVETLEQNGLDASVNILRVLMPGRRDSANHIGFRQPMLTIDGRSGAAPCPLDEAYRDYMRFFFAQYARAGASRIFVDDDFRYESVIGGPTCFCPLHLAEFNRRYGRDLTRDALAAATMESSPNPIKRDWLDFKRATLLELAVLMTEATHSANQEVRVGLMLTYPEISVTGGRKTRELIDAFAGGLRPLVRPGQGWYQDTNRTGFLGNFAQSLYQKELMSADTEVYGEIDSVPHTPFAKSPRTYFDYQIKADLMGGIGIQSAWCFDSEEFVDETHPYARVVRKHSGVHRAIAALIPEGARPRGICPIRSEDAGLLRPQRGEGGYGLKVPVLFWRLGIPAAFGGGDAIVLSKDSVLLDADQVRRAFEGKNALVDLNAAVSLGEIGLSDIIGVRVERMLEASESSFEELTDDPVNGGFTGRQEGVFSSGPVGRLTPLDGCAVRVVSQFRDANEEVTAPGVTLYEGGGRRVAVLPYTLDYSFLSLPKKAQFRGICEWLNGGPLPAFIDDVADVSPFVLEGGDGRKVVGLLNSSFTPAEECDLYIEKPAGGAYSAQFVADSAEVKPVPAEALSERDGYLVIRLSGEMAVAPMDGRVFAIIPSDR